MERRSSVGSGGEGRRLAPLAGPRAGGSITHRSWMRRQRQRPPLLVGGGPWECLGGEGPPSPAGGDPEERRSGCSKTRVPAAGAERAASPWSLLLPRDAGSGLSPSAAPGLVLYHRAQQLQQLRLVVHQLHSLCRARRQLGACWHLLLCQHLAEGHLALELCPGQRGHLEVWEAGLEYAGGQLQPLEHIREQEPVAGPARMARARWVIGVEGAAGTVSSPRLLPCWPSPLALALFSMCCFPSGAHGLGFDHSLTGHSFLKHLQPGRHSDVKSPAFNKVLAASLPGISHMVRK